MYKEGILFTHKYSANWYMHYTAGQCDPKKHYFHKGNTPSDWNRARLSRAEIQVCVSTKLSSWPMGWAICDFLFFFGCRVFPLKCLFLQCETRVDPEPALRWTPNRHVFWKNAVPKPTVRHIYIYRERERQREKNKKTKQKREEGTVRPPPSWGQHSPESLKHVWEVWSKVSRISFQ